MKIKLPKLQDIKSFFTENWFEIIVCLSMFILVNFDFTFMKRNEPHLIAVGYFMLASMLFIKARTTTWHKYLYITFTFVGASLIMYSGFKAPKYEYDAILFFITAIILFTATHTPSKEAFAAHSIKVAQNILVTIITSVAILLCYFLLELTLKSLLSIDILKYNEKIIYLIICIASPLTYIALTQKTSLKDNTKLFSVIGKYILSPTLIIATLIILIYLLKIAIKFELPQESVSTVMMIYLFFGLISQIINIAFPSKVWNWFYKYIRFIALIPTAMLWIALLYRIQQYGFTDMRILVLVIACCFTILSISQFFKSWNYYTPIFIGICCSLFLMYSPIFPAKSFERLSQLHIYNQLTEKLEIYSPDNTLNPSNKAIEYPKEAERVMSIYSTLNRDTMLYVPKRDLPTGPNLTPTKEIKSLVVKSLHNQQIPIGGYSALIMNPKINTKNDSLTVSYNEKIVFKVSVKDVEQQIFPLNENQTITKQMINSYNSEQTIIFTTQQYGLVISKIYWNVNTNNICTIDDIVAECLLVK